MGYKIVTDSTIDLTQKMIEELELTVISLRFTIDGKTYKDKSDMSEMSTETFYAKLREGKMSTTSQINADEFTRTFEPILEAGEDVLYIAFSSGLSGTCQSAYIARDELKEKYPERKIYVFDSLCASMGEGLLVYQAALLKRAGTDIDSLYKWLGENVLKLCHWFTVDDLNHLKRGGRVSTTAALVGTMLGIKPVLHVDDEGHLIPVSKVRGRRQSLDALVQKMAETAIHPDEQTIFISHGDCLKDAEYVAEQVRSKFGVKNIQINFVGPVIGAHSGPGTVALFFFGTQR
ncbi:DegV family protein [Anaeromassilibacillus senegalensis]|uniref:DegV family protein n=1 Tax=Anaeromassilibacillus senegalensis TaxID=1673717 RepID=A0ABS9CJ62_9FIRM|nr:DegV family protein [Anaeromassilibacillus senegalensis]MCF2651189.1 DegV family protein [Anaeromassilibacillus senegalensis]